MLYAVLMFLFLGIRAEEKYISTIGELLDKSTIANFVFKNIEREVIRADISGDIPSIDKITWKYDINTDSYTINTDKLQTSLENSITILNEVIADLKDKKDSTCQNITKEVSAKLLFEKLNKAHHLYYLYRIFLNDETQLPYLYKIKTKGFGKQKHTVIKSKPSKGFKKLLKYISHCKKKDIEVPTFESYTKVYSTLAGEETPMALAENDDTEPKEPPIIDDSDDTNTTELQLTPEEATLLEENNVVLNVLGKPNSNYQYPDTFIDKCNFVKIYSRVAEAYEKMIMIESQTQNEEDEELSLQTKIFLYITGAFIVKLKNKDKKTDNDNSKTEKMEEDPIGFAGICLNTWLALLSDSINKGTLDVAKYIIENKNLILSIADLAKSILIDNYVEISKQENGTIHKKSLKNILLEKPKNDEDFYIKENYSDEVLNLFLSTFYLSKATGTNMASVSFFNELIEIFKSGINIMSTSVQADIRFANSIKLMSYLSKEWPKDVIPSNKTVFKLIALNPNHSLEVIVNDNKDNNKDRKQKKSSILSSLINSPRSFINAVQNAKYKLFGTPRHLRSFIDPKINEDLSDIEDVFFNISDNEIENMEISELIDLHAEYEIKAKKLADSGQTDLAQEYTEAARIVMDKIIAKGKYKPVLSSYNFSSVDNPSVDDYLASIYMEAYLDAIFLNRVWQDRDYFSKNSHKMMTTDIFHSVQGNLIDNDVIFKKSIMEGLSLLHGHKNSKVFLWAWWANVNIERCINSAKSFDDLDRCWLKLRFDEATEFFSTLYTARAYILYKQSCGSDAVHKEAWCKNSFFSDITNKYIRFNQFRLLNKMKYFFTSSFKRENTVPWFFKKTMEAIYNQLTDSNYNIQQKDIRSGVRTFDIVIDMAFSGIPAMMQDINNGASFNYIIKNHTMTILFLASLLPWTRILNLGIKGLNVANKAILTTENIERINNTIAKLSRTFNNRYYMMNTASVLNNGKTVVFAVPKALTREISFLQELSYIKPITTTYDRALPYVFNTINLTDNIFNKLILEASPNRAIRLCYIGDTNITGLNIATCTIGDQAISESLIGTMEVFNQIEAFATRSGFGVITTENGIRAITFTLDGIIYRVESINGIVTAELTGLDGKAISVPVNYKIPERMIKFKNYCKDI